jgi:hypothetical protein
LKSISIENGSSKLYGKGYFIWQLPRCDGGDPERIVARAQAANLSHVLIKIADGPFWAYNYNKDEDIDYVPPVVEALHEAGIQAWGWHYVYGEDPIGEARLAVRRMRSLGMDGYVINAEGEYRDKDMAPAARRFMKAVREGMPDIPMALSSYRFPKRHYVFPFAEFLAECDYAMPQVYFQGAHNPEEQLVRSLEQYMELKPARPVIPTLSTYASGDWRPTPEELTRWMDQARELGLNAMNAWSWDYAVRKKYIDMFDAVAKYDWPPEPPGEDMPERMIGRLNQGDPSFVADLYQDNAAHVTAARTVVGLDPIRIWYQSLFDQILPKAEFRLTGKSGSGNSRHFTWAATSRRGKVIDGNDTLGMVGGKIQYHYTYFTIDSA